MPLEPRLDLIHKAILAMQISWKDSCQRKLRDDRDMRRFTVEGVDLSLQEFVKKGGKLKYRNEIDPDWLADCPNDPWWYSAVLQTPVFKHGLFVKGKLIWENGDDDDEAFFQVISIHEQKK